MVLGYSGIRSWVKKESTGLKIKSIEVYAFCISYEKCKISGGKSYVASCLINGYQ